MQEFHWERHGDEWRLLPVAGETRIVVRKDGAAWNIVVNDAPLNSGNFKNHEGARRVAWQFAYAKRKALFGAYRIKLREESC